jgi:hypothetical protein
VAEQSQGDVQQSQREEALIRRDHSLKAIQQLVEAVTQVQVLRQNEHNERALWTIDQALQVVFDLRAEQVRALTIPELIALCSRDLDPLAQKLVLLADLLKAEAELLAELKQPADSQTQLQALALYLEALTNKNCAVSAEAISNLESLIEQSRGQRLPGQVFRQLVCYFELRGKYAEAEDSLFVWLESGEGGAETEGPEFYDRLAAKGNEDLARGNLPRGEVDEGRREFARRVAAIRPAGRDSTGTA